MGIVSKSSSRAIGRLQCVRAKKKQIAQAAEAIINHATAHSFSVITMLQFIHSYRACHSRSTVTTEASPVTLTSIANLCRSHSYCFADSVKIDTCTVVLTGMGILGTVCTVRLCLGNVD